MSVRSQRPAGLSRGEVFGLLSNPRRCRVLRYLDRCGGSASLSELANAVAARENGGEADPAHRKSVYTSLQQTHLERLDEAGVVEFDRERGHVHATEAAAELELYLEVVPGREFPWREYYLALGAVGTALAIVTLVNLGPFALVPDAAPAAMVTAALTLSAAVQVVREGGDVGEEPPLERR